MKKLGFLGLLLCSVLTMNSQSYVGFHSDNYNGVHGVLFNPANIVDSRFKTDINLVSASGLFGSDYFAIDFGKIGSDAFDLDANTKKFPAQNNNFYANVDVLGPSFMFNINKNNSVALFTRVRTFLNVSEINGELFDNLDNNFDQNKDFNINEGDLYSSTHGWAEVGASYARVLLNKEQHFIKGGLSVKYLQGLGYTSIDGTNVEVKYDADGTIISPGVTTGAITSKGNLSYSSSSNLSGDVDNFELVDGATGFGVDFGFVYEWRPKYDEYKATNKKGNTYGFKDENKYKLKFGLSVTDIGGITYKESSKTAYDLNVVNINEDTFNGYNDFETALDNLYGPIKTKEDVKVMLPTALHATVDYRINKSFYVNLNYDASLSGIKANSNAIVSNATLTPRFESKWFSFYSPIGINKYSDFSWGVGFRAGPLFVGSGSFLSNLISSESKATDVYLGLKIPIYQGKAKDKDKDGIIDKLDGCPREAGPIENNGCPWGDTDGDSVLDNKDQCINVAGPAENNGCPWPDTDGDKILDKDDVCPKVAGLVALNGCPDTDEDGISDDKDKCVDVAGPLENNGCPWPDTDKDGVTDNIDQCPNEAGIATNNGCPEVVIKQEAVKKLNDFARAIYFNSGRASFKPGVSSKLDLIAAIMKEYPKAKFSVEGHTDSAGSAKTNQRLSNKRAKAVLNYLVKKEGVAINRLSSVGYGESNPIADNKTRAGRAENRRVELKLVK